MLILKRFKSLAAFLALLGLLFLLLHHRWAQIMFPFMGLIVLLPLLVRIPMTSSIFSLRTPSQIALFFITVVSAGMAAVFMFEVLVFDVEYPFLEDLLYTGDLALEGETLENTPDETAALFQPGFARFSDRFNDVLFALPEWQRALLEILAALLITLPLSWVTLRKTLKETKGQRKAFYQGLAWGFLGSLLLFAWRAIPYFLFDPNRPVDPTYQSKILTTSTLVFLSLFLVYYIVFRVLFNPQRRRKQRAGKPKRLGSTLAFVLVLGNLLFLVLGLLTLLLDQTPLIKIFPPILLFTMGFTVLFILTKVNHYFLVRKDTASPKDGLETALENRLAKQAGTQKNMVLLNFMGGASQSAVWCNMVMKKLQDELNQEAPGCGDALAQSIVSVSSTSGGSLGSLFYLNAFQADTGHPDAAGTAEAVDQCKENFLESIGWGIAYLDVWRVLFAPISWFFRKKDRGTCLEDVWDEILLRDEPAAQLDQAPTLKHWEPKVLEGQIPIPIFNSTMVGDGRLLMLSPIVLDQIRGNIDEVVDFQSHFETQDGAAGYTMKLSTACRMSATFPFVTPIGVTLPGSRKERRSFPFNKATYAGDGGYFANFGIFSNLLLLRRMLKMKEAAAVKKVFVLNLRAFPDSSYDAIGKEFVKDRVLNLEKQSEVDQSAEPGEKKANQGLLMSLLGPIAAMVSVRSPSQVGRNKLLLQRFTAESNPASTGPKIQTYDLAYPRMDIGGKIYQPPYNWVLNREMFEMNRKALKKLDDAVAFQELKTAWKAAWQANQPTPTPQRAGSQP